MPKSKSSSGRASGDSKVLFAETVGNSKSTSSQQPATASPARKAAAVEKVSHAKESAVRRAASSSSSSSSSTGRGTKRSNVIDLQEEDNVVEENNTPSCNTPIITAEDGWPAEESFKRQTRHAKLSSASATAAALACANAKATVKSNSKSRNSSELPASKGTFSLHLVAGSIPLEKAIHFQLDYTTETVKTLGRHKSCDFYLPNDFVSEW